MKYTFLRNKLNHFILLGFLFSSIPLTILTARHIQYFKQNAATCIPQPKCLMSAPFCYVLEPDEGWCKAVSRVKLSTTSKLIKPSNTISPAK